MKILKPGRDQKGWAGEADCTGGGNGGGGCGARLLVEESDVFLTQRHARDESEDFATFKCEACGVWTDLETGKVPSRVWDKIRSEARRR